MSSQSETAQCWLDQARVDLDAALVKTANESHRRYWLQQSYEKALKCWVRANMIPLDDDYEHACGLIFWHAHSPLLRLTRAKNENYVRQKIGKKLQHRGHDVFLGLHLIGREIRSMFRSSKKHEAMLLQIDATTPSTDTSKISYRYPFYVASPERKMVSPSKYGDQGWLNYQGDEDRVQAAVRWLLDQAEIAVRGAGRREK